MEHSISTNKRIGLSMLRAFACLAVFIVHLGQRLSLSGTIREITNTGAYGVQLFFVLSGFLACLSWDNKKCQKNSFSSQLLNYYFKRIVRLLPLYYFCILFYFITETFIWKSVPADSYGLYWFRYIFLLNAFIPSNNNFWSNLGATWTIPVFFLFYLIFPFLKRFFNTFKKTVVLFIISVCFALAVKLFCHGFLSGFKDLPVFILGMIAYHAVNEGKKELVILGSVVGTIYGHHIDDSWTFSFASIVLIVVFCDYQFSNSKIIFFVNVLDKYSYDVYLLHCVILCGFIDKFDFSRWIIMVIAILGTCILVFAVNKFYEVPIQKWLLRRNNGKKVLQER